MEPHERIRLETLGPDPEVIAYLAPNAETNRSFDNSTETFALPDGESSAVSLDFGSWTAELTVQGFFETTAVGGMPQAQKEDLEELFGKSPVTARDQFNRLLDMTVFGGTGPYALYNEGDEYRAQTQGEVNVAEGIYPGVVPSQIRPALNSGETREAYTIQFDVGVES